MNDIVDKIYVINMKKDLKRFQKVKKQIGNLFTYCIIRGVDPMNDTYYRDKYEKWSTENNTEIRYENFDWRYYINRYPDLRHLNTKQNAWNHWICNGRNELRSCNPNNNIVNRGQWGCLYSHIHTLKHAIMHDYKSVLILEDDIILTADMESKIEQLKKFIEEHDNWNIIYLGASQHGWENIDIKEGYYLANETTGTFAYMVKNSFYKVLLDEFMQIKKPVDNYLADIQRKYRDSIYVLFPNFIICNLEESNICKPRKNSEFYKKFKWDSIEI